METFWVENLFLKVYLDLGHCKQYGDIKWKKAT